MASQKQVAHSKHLNQRCRPHHLKARAVGNAAKQSASSIWSLWSPTNTSNSWPQCKYENASIARPWLSKRTGGLLLQKPIPAFFPILPEPKCHPETDKSFSHTQSTQTAGKRRLTTKLLRLLTYFSILRPPESRTEWRPNSFSTSRCASWKLNAPIRTQNSVPPHGRFSQQCGAPAVPSSAHG